MKRKRDSMAFAGQKGNRVVDKLDDSKCQEHGPSLADLPYDITTHILLKLPMKSVLICRCVCKSWNTLISDPNFARLHFIHAPVGAMIRTNDPNLVSRTLHLLEYEPEKLGSDEKQFCCCGNGFLNPNCNRHVKVEPKFKLPLRGERSSVAYTPSDDKFSVVNSCNGFLCLCGPWDRDPLAVCNPITGEFIRLPAATRIAKMGEELISSGFGFDPKTKEYKVLRMWKRYVIHREYNWQCMFDVMFIEMHTLGTSTWRNVGVDPRYLVWLRFPTCLNGALHWIGFDGKKGSIFSFNFDTEMFQSFPSPPQVFERYNINNSIGTINIGELSGSLCICDVDYSGCVGMWVMEKYGIGGSWTQVFNIEFNDAMCWNLEPYGLYRPLKQFQLKKGSAILMYHSSDCFVYYESRSQGLKFFKVRGIRSDFEVVPHIPSLISLKDAIKGDNVEVLKVNPWCAAMKLREENEVLFLAEAK